MKTMRAVATRLRARTGNVLALRVITKERRVVLTNATGSAPAAGRLVDDQTFKDALAAADAPEEVSWLAYADIQRLAPIIQALTQLMGMPLSEEQKRTLERVGTVTAFAARSRLVLRVSGR
jgi:hypothetical protein